MPESDALILFDMDKNGIDQQSSNTLNFDLPRKRSIGVAISLCTIRTQKRTGEMEPETTVSSFRI